ncbi:MAG: phenylalanine--tRNA ligase subunit beta, partial [Rhodoferax sp.]|nr:phenylalanine--tRNA ligase subunit beta [Rhodoferax sp.]
QETINFSFVESRWEQELAGNPDPVRLLNPISSTLNVMRSSLMGSLLQVLKFNLDRKAPRVRVFEIGRVFLRDGSVRDSDTTVAGFHQPLRVAGLISGSVDRLQWSRQAPVADFFDAKGDVEALLAPAAVVFDRAEHPALHPGRCARVSVNGLPVGFVGELHPRWRQSYELSQSPMLFELDLAVVQQHRVPVFAGVPRVQAVERDIAVWVPEALAHDALLDAIRSAPTGGLLRDAVLFDIYRPKPGGPAEVAPPAAEQSMAVRLRLQSDEATLTDAQIDQAVQAVLLTLSERVGARQRA